jgi:hypothetical protein
MAVVRLSVEEYINRFSINDSDIQELLALNSVLLDQNDESFANNTCIPCDGFDFIGKKEKKLLTSDLLFIFRSTKL